MSVSLEGLWQATNFRPNPSQEAAIRHIDGPLFLTAGPGSGKTRVLLWRTLNLIVFQEVKPEEIFLSTFTEKAAYQLKEGLKTLLALVTNHTGQSFDISKMFVGTVHSLCQKILSDRRFSTDGKRPKSPDLFDELDQYFYLYRQAKWHEILMAGGFENFEIANKEINEFIDGSQSSSRHHAVTNCIALSIVSPKNA